MFIEGKSAQEFYQMFFGIYENKLFLQFVDRQGEIKYNFECAKELDRTNERSTLFSIQESIDEFFMPPFAFDPDFILGTDYPYLIRREGEKVIGKSVVKCEGFGDLPAFNTTIYMDTYLPFEKPMERQPVETNIESLIANSPKWITIGSFLGQHGMTD